MREEEDETGVCVCVCVVDARDVRKRETRERLDGYVRGKGTRKGREGEMYICGYW